MTILFDATAARQTNNPSFGEGLIPASRVGRTAADEAWAAQMFGDLAAARINRRIDRRAEQAAWQSSIDSGYRPV